LPFPESGLVPLRAGEEMTWQMAWHGRGGVRISTKPVFPA
jgi:hypothetical protein